jgi:hypothetical protein
MGNGVTPAIVKRLYNLEAISEVSQSCLKISQALETLTTNEEKSDLFTFEVLGRALELAGPLHHRSDLLETAQL